MDDTVQVRLIRQDSADCQNTTVQDDPERTVGTIICDRSDYATTVIVECTLKADTTYIFNLKCKKQLGTFRTDDEGVANVKFAYGTKEAGDVYAFDCYADPEVPGDVYQSLTVRFA